MVTLRDKLSHLSFTQACKLLGSQGKALIMRGGQWEIDLFEQVSLSDEKFQLFLDQANVEISLNNAKRMQLDLRCSMCAGACEHQGAALSLILEEKMALGLAAPPPERVPVESLSEEALIAQAISDRKQRALEEKMRLKSMSPDKLWTDYVVTNAVSGKSYRIALRGWEHGRAPSKTSWVIVWKERRTAA
ncbi:MAG: hypothetical protein P8X55_07360 [Desulfosarcinaceae bacterium]